MEEEINDAIQSEFDKLGLNIEEKFKQTEAILKKKIAGICANEKKLTFNEFIGIDGGTFFDDPDVLEASRIFKVVYSYHDIGLDLGREEYAENIPFQERFNNLKVPSKLEDWDNPLYNFYDRYRRWTHVDKLILGIETFQPTKGTEENSIWKVWPNKQLSAEQWGDSPNNIRENARKYFYTLIQMFEGHENLPRLPFDEVIICILQEAWGDPGLEAIQQIYLGAGDAWKQAYPYGNRYVKLCSGAMQAWEPLGKLHDGIRLHDYVGIIPNIPDLDFLSTHPYALIDNTFSLSGLPEGLDNEHRHVKKMMNFGKPVLITEDGYNFDGKENFDKQFRAAVKAYIEGAKVYCIYDLVQKEGDVLFHNTGLTHWEVERNVAEGEEPAKKLIKRPAWNNWKFILDNFGDLEMPTLKEQGDNFTWVTTDEGQKEYNFAWTHDDSEYFHPVAGRLNGAVKIWETP